jgi:hypothetical protein
MAISMNHRKLLEECQQMVQTRLAQLMERMFENADIALLDFAQKAQSNVAQSQFFEAMNEIQKKSNVVERRFLEEVTRTFSEFPDWSPAKPDQPDTDSDFDFALVNEDTMEEDVALKNALNKLNARIKDDIYALRFRLSFMLEDLTIEDEEIPGGPVAIIQAFQSSLRLLDMETKVRLVVISLFDKFVVAKTPELYADYNKILVQANILPNLKYKIKRNKNSGTSPTAPEHMSTKAAADTEEADRDYSGSPSELGDEVFGMICQLLAGRQRSGPSSTTSGRSAAVTPLHDANGSRTPEMSRGASGSVTGPALAPATSLVGSISQMQNHVQAGHTLTSSNDFIESIEVDENLVNTLQQTLTEEREKIVGAVDRRKVPTADADVIDLVGMLFEYMLKEEQLPNIVKAALSRLHTPFLKVAILDRRFFTQSRHPARSLLNSMIAAGIRWVNEVKVEDGIFPKIRQIIDDTLMDFEDDVSIFETYLADFENAVFELKHRSSTVEKRTNEAANGQERLLAARGRAQEEIAALCGGKDIIKPASDLLTKLWSDRLTFILLREPQGDQSDAWKSAVDLAGDVLANSTQPVDDQERRARAAEHETLHKRLREALATTQHAEKEAILLALNNAQLDLVKDTGEVNPPEVVTIPTPTKQKSQSAEDVEELTEAETEALKTLESIAFGTWFEFIDGDSGKISRVKLSWRSTVTQKFMFVDQMGVKTAIIPTLRLAQALANGSARIITEEKKPFMDRALGAIHRMLDLAVAESA